MVQKKYGIISLIVLTIQLTHMMAPPVLTTPSVSTTPSVDVSIKSNTPTVETSIPLASEQLLTNNVSQPVINEKPLEHSVVVNATTSVLDKDVASHPIVTVLDGATQHHESQTSKEVQSIVPHFEPFHEEIPKQGPVPKQEVLKEAHELVMPTEESKHPSVTSGIDFEEKEDGIGLVDTTHATSGGNWLLKRIWGEKAEEVFDQIKALVKKTMDARLLFFTQRNEIDKKFDQFYQAIGFDQGSLEDIINFALEVYDKVKKDELNQKEKVFFESIKEKQTKIAQIKKDIESIVSLDSKINEGLDVLLSQIDLCNKYEDQAWENFRDILRELNDKEARRLYFETKDLQEDVQKIADYISGPFNNYFGQLLQNAQDHMKNISSQLNTLKNEGIDLKKEALKLEKEEDVTDFLEQQKQKIASDKKALQENEASQSFQKNVGWFSKVITSLDTLYQTIINGIKSFFGSPSKSGKDKKNEVVTAKK